ncbi:MAG TPA: DHA2 family efflux MFS transporter permease subunit [Deltaproteobacteria bacterium]|nr:DHA2 family efflux MFS transporter permease subunit [Deltaproteobacteria bacterium]HPI93650.1 DHA2 family efflux MFS transporter permease subunit [Deltaproteobacteria bacterium]HPR54570.1 DHA2 family efflux MFS transporter permease subunit [Deltaproteobacteria bacterium]
MSGKLIGTKWIITLTVMTGTIMSAIDTSIVNVALPVMRGTLGASVEEITWVSTGYILSNVIIMPIVALLSSRFGRKRFYMFSVLLFTCASMLCGLAGSLGSIVFFRIVQGIGGGALIPVSQAILRETFPPKEQAMAMGLYGIGVILGPAIGPTLGGWLTDNYSWPWIFYINVPIGILNILLVMRFIEDPPYLLREKGTIDLAGLLFMSIGLGALQIMLEKGEQKDWFSSNFIITLAVISSVGLMAFTWRELTTDRPAVNLKILKDINFTSATFLGGILGLALMGSLFLLPLLLQQLLGFPAFDSGLALLPRSIAMAISMPIGGRLYNRFGPRMLIGTGLAVNALSFYEFSCLSLDMGYWDIFLPQFLQGIGFGLIFVSLSTAALSSVEKPLMTAATGLYNVIRQVFGSIGIAVSATLLTQGENWNRAVLVKNINAFSDIASGTLDGFWPYLVTRGVNPFVAKTMALKMMDGFILQQASMLSYNHVFSLIAILFLCSIPLIIFIKDARLDMGKDVVTD